MNTRRELDASTLKDAAWPAHRIAEAVHALAQHAGLPVSTLESVPLPEELPVEQLSSWIESIADRFGVQTDHAFVALDEIEVLLASGGPLLLRLSAIEGTPFLAVA